MSNIDKQALREEFQYMQDHYSDPADRDRQIIYIAAEALLDELEKAQCANVAQDDHINQQQDRIEQLEKGHKEAAKQINSWRRLAKQNIAERGKDISELEAARQRIAELESKLSNPVLLPKTNGYWNEQEKAYEEAITLAKRRIRMAGFRCEGDE